MKRGLAMMAVLILLLGLLTGCKSKVDAGLEFTVNGDEVEVTRYSGNADRVEIPSSYDGKPVTSIAARAFYNHTGLNTVRLPQSVLIIGSEAFALCPFLKTFEVEEKSLTYSALDGVLYSADGTVLVQCPEGR